MKKSNMQKPRVISLFAGCGGLDIGFHQQGYDVVWANDLDEWAAATYKHNLGDAMVCKDIEKINPYKDKSIPVADLILGGFPCQDVSLAGNRKGLEGSRSTLWSEFYRIVCEVQPRWVVIENVPGLLSSDNGEFFTKILRELSKNGYAVTWQVISASSIGAMHIRERVFIVANAEGSYSRQSHISKEYSWEQNYQREWSRFWNELIRRCENSRKQNYWIPQSRLVRLVDGLSSRLDKSRMKANGNAVVSQVAEIVGHCVLKAETCLTNA